MTEPETPQSGIAAPHGSRQPQSSSQRFGIGQLMILVAIFAVSLACAFPGTRLPGTINPGSLIWKMIFGLSELTLGVLCLSGAAYCISRWLRDRQFPQQPGYLLLMYCAAAFLMSNIVAAIFAFIIDYADAAVEQNPAPLAAGVTVVKILPCIVLLVAAATGLFRDRWWWRYLGFLSLVIVQLLALGPVCLTYFYMIDQDSITPALLQRSHIAASIAVAVSIGLVLVCGLIDLFAKQKRERGHWLGVGCFLLFAIVPSVVRIIAAKFLTTSELFGLPT